MWFFNRRLAWMWLLQDLLSMCVCILFVKALRLPSLRVASVFLGLMFFYDIFMVRRVSPPHPSDALTYPRLPCNFSRSDPGTPPTPLLPHRLPLPPLYPYLRSSSRR